MSEKQKKKELDSDYDDFTKKLNLINNQTPANILEQLPAYNYNQNVEFINDLLSELDQQKTLNMILEKKEYKENIENIKKFTELNSKKVDKQLKEIKEISKNLTDIVIKNKELEKENIELLELQEGEEFQSLADNMREIKREKEEIKDFLRKMGIVSPPLILEKS